MAKTRAQRKAERRAREAQRQKQATPKDEARAQHETQVPQSGDVAEVEAVEAGMGAGAPEEALDLPETPKKSRAERRDEAKAAKEQERRDRERQRLQERERLEKERSRAAGDERRRGRVTGFLASCWAELKRVQWPDRDTLVQASAVTIVFVAVAAAYLGALDAVFNFLVKRIL